MLAFTASASLALFLAIQLLPGVLYHVFAASVYLPVHNLAELASILVSFGIFLVNWHSSPQRHNARNLLLGVGFLGVAILDALHMLSFPGMPNFVTASSTNKGILYWLAARLTEAVALLVAAFIAANDGRSWLRRRPLLAGMLGIVAAVFVAASFYEQRLPAMYLDGVGLTPLKVGLEYLVIGLNLAAIVAYVRGRGGHPRQEMLLLLASLAVIVFAELAFTLYRSAYDSYNLLGHVFKVVAYYLLFRALFVSSIEEPYRALARLESEQARLYRSERRKSRELLAIGHLLQSPLSLVDRLDAVVRAACDLLDVEAAAILVLDEAQDGFTVVAGRGIADRAQQDLLPRSGALAKEVLVAGEARWVGSLELRPELVTPRTRGDAFRSAVSVPLRVEGSPVGTLEAYSRRPEFFGARQATLLAGFADGAAIAMAQARAHDEIQALLSRKREHEQRLAEQNEELQNQSAEIQAQNEELLAQTAEIEAQNDELAQRQRELEQQNSAVERANRQLSELYEISRLQEARTRAIIDATGDGIMVVDAAQRVIAVNPALEVMTGSSGADLVGSVCKYLLHACQSDGQLVCDAACPFLHQPGRAPNSVDAVLPGHDGREVWVNIVYGPIYDQEGKIIAVVHAIRDISARKELERQKDEFLSIAAHDLKSPLTAIRGYAQLMMRRAVKEQRASEDTKALEVIEAQVERMVGIINRLLDVTRIQMGRLELQIEAADLAKVAQRVVAQHQVSSELHRFVLEAPPDELLIGSFDRVAIERVLANLVENAIKYSPKGGTVRIGLDRRNGELHVVVCDEGIGIRAGDLERVFDRYYRASGAREAAKGLGLGLYIAKSIVEAHGGRMWVESSYGHGTSVSFALPVEATAQAGSEPGQPLSR